MKISLLLLALLLTWFLANPLSAEGIKLDVLGVTGQDNRQISETRDYPWSAIGRLNITTGGFCTATVIGPRRLLTAAHCLWNQRTGRWLPPCALHFLAGYQRGEYAVHALVAKIQVVSGFVKGGRDPGKDWAVVTLDRDVSAQTGFIPVQALPVSRQTRLIQAGYSRDHRHVLTVDSSCKVMGLSRQGDFMAHSCDATFGDSGSPLLVKKDSGFELVGVHVAVRGRGETAQGIAVSNQAFSQWLKANPVSAPLGGVEACFLGHPLGGNDA